MNGKSLWLKAPVLVSVLFLAVQLLTARFAVPSFDSPNASVYFARNLAVSGNYSCNVCARRLYGDDAGLNSKPLLAFQLPGEPLYLAACFRLLPPGLLRYIQLPFTVLLVFGASYAAARLFGPLVSFITGVIACLEPFVALHGPVWDDTFLGAALEWMVFALLIGGLMESRGKSASSKRWARVVLIVAFAGYASVTRHSSRITLAVVCILIFLVKKLRPIRVDAIAALAGMCIALFAWGYRNSSVSGEFTIGTSDEGIALWESVYPYAGAALLAHGQTETMNAGKMQDDFARTRSLSEQAANRYFLRRAVRYLIAEPMAVGRTAALKIAVDLSGISPPASVFSRRNLVSWLSNLLLLILAVVGAGRIPLSSEPEFLLAKIVAASSLLVYVSLSFLGPVGLRYRISLEPVLWICGAVCLASIAHKGTWPSAVRKN